MGRLAGAPHRGSWSTRLTVDAILSAVEARLLGKAEKLSLAVRAGRVVRCSGEMIWSTNLGAPIGARCNIRTRGAGSLAAEVVGLDNQSTLLMSERGVKGVRIGDVVIATPGVVAAMVGEGLMGRVLDAYGAPLDGQPLADTGLYWPLAGIPINPMIRERIEESFDVGVRGINGMTTLGRGMRVGLFAGSGVGKSTLLGMTARHAQADCVVIAMIGERGREVREFIEDHLGEALARSVVVVSAADSPPLARVHGAMRAASIAEYFRERGHHVLFLVDSLTRLAMARREIGLSVGEPAATKGYPPSVFGQLATYVERAGNGGPGMGSITGIYTVLVEADDHVGDPVADAARSVLDGHIVLSRRSSEAGIYPPIDLSMSLSRPMSSIIDSDHAAAASRFRLLWSRLEQKRELVDIGAYAPGRDPVLDQALTCMPKMEAFLRQSADQNISMRASVEGLKRAISE